MPETITSEVVSERDTRVPRHPSHLLLLALVLLPLAGGVSPARADTLDCTAITSTVVITSPGIYCLTADVVANQATGSLIRIDADNVILDLNGHRVENTNGLDNETACINAGGDSPALTRRNITIRNGTVRGCEFGVWGRYYTENILIEDLRIDRCTHTGINMNSRTAHIRNNQILRTGGKPGVNAGGIYWGGSTGFITTGVVEDTAIRDTSGGASPYGLAVAYGEVLAVNNRIAGGQLGIYYSTPSQGTGKYRDNITSGIGSIPYFGGTDAGNNQ